MASSTSSAFTASERRKKAVTYGKSSRLPPSRPSLFEADAPSPERLHTQNAPSSGPSAGGGSLKAAQPPRVARAATDSPDVFDVPSEDEFGFPTTPPAKPLVVQRSKRDGSPRAGTEQNAVNGSSRPSAPSFRPQQRTAIARSGIVRSTSSQCQTKPQRTVAEKEKQIRVQPAKVASQAQALRATKARKQVSGGEWEPQRSATSSQDVSRATIPGTAPQRVPKSQPTEIAATTTSMKTARPTARPSASLDVFDVPSDNEFTSLPIPAAPRQTSRPLSKAAAKRPDPRKASPLDATVRQSALGDLRNRKRKGSVSLTSVPAPAAVITHEAARETRDCKVPKRQTRTSPSRNSAKQPAPKAAAPAETSERAVNKPRRTRTRTVPVISQPTMMKGQSSPAVLHAMLPIEQAMKSSHEDDSVVLASDDTMYDIPDPVMTPVRPTTVRKTTATTPGSVTPRQKDLFSTLLGSSGAPKTPASALAALQITEKNPRSLLGALARSKSDVSYSSQSRRTRLIDTLRDDDTSSEEDDSENDAEVDRTIVTTHDADNDKTPVQTKRKIIEEATDDITTNGRNAGESQISQVSSGAANRPKLTYATQRSYLQEANPEDEFMMSMEVDDGWKMDSQTVSTDDEDGSMSQPRTHHELRKYGQTTMFSWDMEESIREISDSSNRSGRRSAMIDLCTKMVDAGFISQLLDSGFMHKLLENVVNPGDVIFDFVAAVSVLFVVQTRPAFAVVDQIYRSGIMVTLISLIDKDTDISRVARDRKSNMSRIAQESLADFRSLVLAANIWSPNTPGKLSPQLVALKAMDLLVQSRRESGNIDALLTPTEVSKVVSVCSLLAGRIKTTKSSPQDTLILDLAISILETVSITDQDHSTWPTKNLHHLSEVIAVFFGNQCLGRTVEAMKLCMNLTNNKPKACQPFSVQPFVQPLVQFIVGHFSLLDAGDLDPERRSEVLAALTLSLGAMINLAELNEQARLNAVEGTNSIEVLASTFIVGSQRAAEASSVEESEVGVVIGFLAVLLGMLSLNSTVKSRIQALLPGQRIDLLLQNMSDFARIHEHVDKKTARRFEGSEGQETLNNYYVRIMHVVKKLESAKT